MTLNAHQPRAALPGVSAEMILQGVDVATVGICVTSVEDGRFLYVNDMVCTLLGLSREQLLDLTILDVMRPEDHAGAMAARQAMVDGVITAHKAERSYPRPDGSSLWAVIRVTPIRDESGAVTAFFSHLVDVTERKQREERLASYTSDAVWLGRIRDAIDNSRFVLYSQPIVDLRTGETVQRELLLRMRDEDGTIIPPGAFLPVAERYGLIAEIDRWVIRKAGDLAAQGMQVEFNLSAASIGNPDVLRELTCQLGERQISPSLLIAEVTETAMLQHPAEADALAKLLRSIGCDLAIDDFGTGFATLSMLKHVPAQYLKIDREFVRDVADNETDQRLVRAVVHLAREFGMTTIAEGVEDARAMATLIGLGVDCAQGYLFAEPSPLVDGATRDPGFASTRRSGGSDAVATVRCALDAIAQRDLKSTLRLTHPSVVMRPLWPSAGADPDGAYRGHEGVARYIEAIPQLAEQLDFHAEVVWEAGDAVVAFGRFVSAGETLTVIDAMAVYRVRNGLIVSVQVFEQPDLDRAPITQNGW